MKRKTLTAVVILFSLASLGSCPCDYECSIVTQQVPAASIGVQYAVSLESHLKGTCGLGTKTDDLVKAEWVVASGSLPPGLQLSRDGLLTGVPTEAGVFRVSFAARCQPSRIDAQPQALEITVRS